jgi:hypothetical protein
VGGVITAPPTATPAEPRGWNVDPHVPSAQLTGVELPDPALDHGALPPADPGLWGHPAPHPHPADPDHHDFGIHG